MSTETKTIEIVTYPSRILKERSIPVAVCSMDDHDRVGRLVEKMKAIISHLGALGLAANQVNDSRAVFVFKRSNGELVDVINPEILSRGSEMGIWSEGCLSFPGKKSRTRRPRSIRVGFHSLTKDGYGYCVYELEGHDAVVFQHEFDHLQGKSMMDRNYMRRR